MVKRFPNDPKQPPWRQFLDEVGEAGYEWIELGPYGYLPTDFPTLKTEIAGRGLKLSGGFVMRHFEDVGEWPLIEKELNAVGTILASFGSRFRGQARSLVPTVSTASGCLGRGGLFFRPNKRDEPVYLLVGELVDKSRHDVAAELDLDTDVRFTRLATRKW